MAGEEHRVAAGPGCQLVHAWSPGLMMHTHAVGTAAAAVMEPQAAPWLDLDQGRRRLAFAVAPLYVGLRRQLQQLGRNQQAARRQALQQYSKQVAQALQTVSEEYGGNLAIEAALWDLLHMFFLEDDMGAGYFSEAFAGWLRHHMGTLSTDGSRQLEGAAAFLAAQQRPEASPHFWATVLRFVLVGQLDEALEVMLLHPAYAARDMPAAKQQVEVLEGLVQLLKLVPILTTDEEGRLGAGQPTNDPTAFAAARAEWLGEVEGQLGGLRQALGELRRADAAMADGVQRLLMLLAAGSQQPATSAAALQVMAGVAGNWVELLAGLLLWKFPTAQPHLHLKGLVLKAASEQPAEGSNDVFLALLAQLLPAAADSMVQQIITAVTNSPFCHAWFVTHLFDVLRGWPAAEAVLARPLASRGCEQCEMFTLSYAQLLAGHQGTWLLAAEYLAWCPQSGQQALELLLESNQYATQTPAAVRQSLAIAQRHNLRGTATRLVEKVARAAVASGCLLGGLQWLLEVGEVAAAQQLLQPQLEEVVAALQSQVSRSPEALEPLDCPWLEGLGQLLTACGARASSSSSSSSSRDRMALSSPTSSWDGMKGGSLRLLGALLDLQEGVAALQQAAAASGGVESMDSEELEEAAAAPYQLLRGPIMALLGPGGAPLLLQLLLLAWLRPLLRHRFCPLDTQDLQQLQRLLVEASGIGASIAEAVAGQQQCKVQAGGLAAWQGRSRQTGWQQGVLQGLRADLVHAATTKRLAVSGASA